MKKEALKKLIRKKVPEYRDYLNLSEWEVRIFYDEGEQETDHSTRKVAMQIDISIAYLSADLTVFKTAWEECDKDYIKRMLVHELCHIITEPQYSLCRDNVNPHLHPFVEEQREQETERIARIAQKALGLW